jgi:hypothetical protein
MCLAFRNFIQVIHGCRGPNSGFYPTFPRHPLSCTDCHLDESVSLQTDVISPMRAPMEARLVSSKSNTNFSITVVGMFFCWNAELEKSLSRKRMLLERKTVSIVAHAWKCASLPVRYILPTSSILVTWTNSSRAVQRSYQCLDHPSYLELQLAAFGRAL